MAKPIADRFDATAADGAALDSVFSALEHPYRRRILLLVSDRNPRDEAEFAVADLATEDDDRELLLTDLYHVHLPALADAGYLDWDRETNTVTRGPKFDDVAPVLRLLHDHQDELPAGWP